MHSRQLINTLHEYEQGYVVVDIAGTNYNVTEVNKIAINNGITYQLVTDYVTDDKVELFRQELLAQIKTMHELARAGHHQCKVEDIKQLVQSYNKNAQVDVDELLVKLGLTQSCYEGRILRKHGTVLHNGKLVTNINNDVKLKVAVGDEFTISQRIATVTESNLRPLS